MSDVQQPIGIVDTPQSTGSNVVKDSTIFYSWQGDNKKTKNFIDKALKAAIKDIAASGQFNKPLVLDRDTKDVLGSPHIVRTILDKIDACEIFVADVSLIDRSSNGRILVNQNVMFELGYAIAKHTDVRVITLFNSDLGDMKDGPFDISHYRSQSFSVDNDKGGVRLRRDLYSILLKYLTAEIEQTIPGHDDYMYAKLKRDIAQFLSNDPIEVAVSTQDSDPEMDDTERLIMRLFASMVDEKRILVIRTMGGSTIVPHGDIDQGVWKELEGVDAQEIVSNLNELVDRGTLMITYSKKGTPSYTPTKRGFGVIKKL